MHHSYFHRTSFISKCYEVSFCMFLSLIQTYHPVCTLLKFVSAHTAGQICVDLHGFPHDVSGCRLSHPVFSLPLMDMQGDPSFFLPLQIVLLEHSLHTL